MDAAVIKGIATAAKAIFDFIVSQLEGELDNQTMLRNILNAIAEARDDILNFLESLQLNDLQGDIDGLMITFEAYDPLPEGGGDPIPSEEERLRNIIDNAAQVIGDLGAIIQTQRELDFVFGCVPLLAMVVSLRAAAMAERTLTYDINDLKDVPSMVRRARERLVTVRRLSDSRFGPVTTRRGEPGFADVGYKFEDEFMVLLQMRVNEDGNLTALIPAFVSERRSQHMQRAYREIPGVVEIMGFPVLRIQRVLSRHVVVGPPGTVVTE